MLNRFFHEEDGQTLVEYGLLISLLALVAIIAMALFGSRVRGMYGNGASKYPDPVTS